MGIREDWQKWYRALKQAEPEAYRKAIQYIESVSLQFDIPQGAAAEYERTTVMLVCELLGITP